MNFRQRLQADKAAFSQLKGVEKLHFLWDYYKIPILAVGFAVLLAVLSLLTGSDYRKSAMYAVFVNCDAPAELQNPDALDALLSQAGVDMDGKTIDITANLTLGRELDEVYDGQTTQVLAAMFGISGLDLFAADAAVFERYASQDAFMDLNLLIEPELLDAFPGEFYRYNNSDGQEILGGLILKDGSPLHEAGYYRGDVVIGIAHNAQFSENARLFLRQLVMNWVP